YTVYASKDKAQYDEIARKEDDRPVSTTGDIYRFSAPVLARYVKVEMTHNSANASVHMNEMRVYGTPSEYEDPSLINIARGKPAYSMAGTPGVITDGNYSNYWDGSAAPSEFEIDLEKWYDLSKLVLFPYFGDGRYYHYEIYTSCNGLNYTLLTQKDNDDIAVAAGDTYAIDEPVLARFIKVRMTFNSANPSVHMKELEAYGLLTDHEEPVFELPGEDPADPDNIAFGKPVRVPMNSYYAPRITDGNNDTYWGAQYYPSYADIDLKENYALSDITVIAPAADGRYYGYSIYSTDGVN
ncbi:MAG: discoidin domain-containing protein, partial [Oscillospiraceae bacterium]